MYPSPDQPKAVKLVNRTGRLLQKVGIKQPSLTAERLIKQAQKKTGLRDFGDDSFRKGLTVLIESLESEARLSFIGRIAAKGMIIDNLVTRLQITDYRKRRPEIKDKPVVQPLIIAGLPRTGTTILHELLAQDPALRSPLSWEVASPMPPARAETYDSDPRIAKVEATMAQTEVLAPGFKAIHEVGALLPQECVSILASHFISDQFGAVFSVPSYRQWCRTQDMTAAYQWHNQFLQHLQADYMQDRWVLKTPVHIGYVKALLAQYPDACVVQTHRDPMDVIGSVSSLACTLRSAFSDDIDPLATGQQEVEHFADLLKRGMAQRESILDQSQFYDMQFRDIVSDPLAAIEKMYTHFGFDFTDHARQAMQLYIDKRPRNKHGKHSYTLNQFGLSREAHGHLFEPYRQRYCT